MQVERFGPIHVGHCCHNVGEHHGEHDHYRECTAGPTLRKITDALCRLNTNVARPFRPPPATSVSVDRLVRRVGWVTPTDPPWLLLPPFRRTPLRALRLRPPFSSDQFPSHPTPFLVVMFWTSIQRKNSSTTPFRCVV